MINSNLLIAGPCGVGKSTIARSIAQIDKLKHLDFDTLRSSFIELNGAKSSPFSISASNLADSIAPILNKLTSFFILDIGGDTVFREKTNNEARLQQVVFLKEQYNIVIIVLSALREVLYDRFLSVKCRSTSSIRISDFEYVWNNWELYSKPKWDLCGDIFIDTSNKSLDETLFMIRSYFNSQ